MNNILTGRKFDTSEHPELRNNGLSWYAPSELLRNFKSVIDVTLINTCNSGGDWQGYIAQKVGKRTYIIVFEQESNYPSGGYTVYTANTPAISFVGEMSEEEITAILCQQLND